MTLISSNIRFLRRQKNLTQEELGREVGLTRAVIGAYEEGRAEPKLPALEKLSRFFGVTIDDFICKDFSIESAKGITAQQDDPQFSGKKLRILSITLDPEGRENIELVPQKAAAGYLNGYADPEYLEQLPRFRLPMLPQGTYRAFEISGDSMLPLQPGSVVIGEYVQNWRDIRDGHTYILVTKRDGIVYKRTYNRMDTEKRLVLHSDNPVYQTYDLPAEEIVEAWKAKAFYSTAFPEEEMSMEKLSSMVMDLQKEVGKMKRE